MCGGVLIGEMSQTELELDTPIQDMAVTYSPKGKWANNRRRPEREDQSKDEMPCVTDEMIMECDPQ